MRMKNLFALTFACAALSACSSDEITDKDTTVTGKDTWAAFSIQLPKTMTRATDANSTSAETTVKTVAVYIADKTTGAIATSGIKTLDEYKDGAITDNTITTKVAVKTSPGEKMIWAVLNLTEAMHKQITDKTGLGGLQTAFTTVVTGMTGGYQYATETGVTNHTGFVMASKEILTKTLQADIKEDAAVGGTDETKNHFSIQVERAVAKVSAVAKENGIENKLSGEGTFSDFKYYVSQVNPATYIARWTDATTQPKGYNIVTPNNNNDGSTSWGNTVMKDTPLPVNTFETANNNLNGIYVLENSMLDPLQQNSTCLVVQAKWTPKTVYQADGTTPGTLNADGDFWYYNGKYYAQAPTGLAADAADAVKWTGGICYYRTYLYDKYTNNVPNPAGEKFYDVVRNTCYNVTINSVMAPGSNTPTPPPTPSPIVEDTWVSVNVDILAWTFANMDGVDLQ